MNAFFLQGVAISCLFAIAAYLPLATGKMVACFGAVAGVGGVVTGHLLNAHWPLSICLIAGGLGGAVLLVAIGAAFRRLSGLSFALATLSVGEVLHVVAINSPRMGEATGFVVRVPALTSIAPFGVLGLVCTMVFLLELTPLRKAMTQVAADAGTARASGIADETLLIGVLAVAGFIAGVAGGLYANLVGVVSPELWSFNKSIEILLFAVAGGSGYFVGPVLSVLLLTSSMELLRLSGNLRIAFYGAVMVLIAVVLPQGLVWTRPARIVRLVRARMGTFRSVVEAERTEG